MSATQASPVRKFMAVIAAGMLALTGAGVIVVSTAQSASAADLTITVPEGAYPGIQLSPTLTVAGTADAGELITVTSDLPGATDCQATADTGGSWTCDITNMPNSNTFTISAERAFTGGIDFASKPIRGVLLPPVVTSANPMLTTSATPTVTGNFAIPSSETVEVGITYEPGVQCSTTSGPGGDWSCTSTVPEGSYPGVAVTQTVSYGAASATSNPTYIDVVVDHTGPPTPVILSPGDSSVSGTPTYSTSDLTPAVSGTGEPGSTTTVWYGPNTTYFYDAFCTAPVDVHGSWSCESPFTFDVGESIVLSVFATDAAGNTGASPDPEIQVNFVAPPDAPTFETPADGYSAVNPYVYFSGLFSGPAYPLTVLVNGESACEPAYGEGIWNCTGGPYAAGSHIATAYVTDAYGTPSAEASRSFAIESPTPSDPTLDSPAGEGEGGAVSSVATPFIEGSAEPNANPVTVLYQPGYGSEEYAPYCTTSADDTGYFACSGPALEVDQLYTFGAQQTDSLGMQSPGTAQLLYYTVLPPPEAPVVDSPTGGQVFLETMVQFSGLSGYAVTVVVNDEETCTVIYEEGTWRCTGGPYLPGSYTAEIFATDFEGVASPSVFRSFTIVGPVTDPSIDSPTGGEGGVYSSDLTPLIAGRAIPNAHPVTVLYHEGIGSGQYLTYCETTADDTGHYSCTGQALEPGRSYTFGARQTDQFGTPSPGTAELMYYTTLLPPDAPAFIAPAMGHTALDPFVEFSGLFTGPSYPLTILVDGQPACEASIGEGDWYCTAGPYAPGTYTATAYVTDVDGTPSEPATRTFTIQSPFAPPTLPISPVLTHAPTPTPIPTPTPPALEVILAVTDAAGNDLTGKPVKAGQTVVITGSGAPAGSTAVIELHSDPITLGSTTARPDGTFSLTALIPRTVVPGEHHFVAIVTPAGQAPGTFEQAATIEAADVDPVEEKATAHPDKADVIAFLAGLGGSADNGFDSPSSFTSSLKTATGLRLTPALIGVTALIASAFLLLVAFPAELLESTVRANYSRVFGWVAPITRRLTRISDAIKRIPVSNWIATVGIIALTALILGFADPGFGFNGSSLRLWIALVASITILNVVVSSIVMTVAKRRFSAASLLEPMPAALILVVLSVLVSRLIGMQPGFLFGVVLGVAFAIELNKRQNGLLSLLAIGLSLVIGVGAWLGYTAFATSGVAEPGFWHLLVQETLAATTVEALATMTVTLLPLKFLDGETLFEWNRWVWAGTYVVAIVAFVVVILPLSGNWGEMSAPLLGWGAFFAGFAVLAVGIWAVFRFMPVRAKQAA